MLRVFLILVALLVSVTVQAQVPCPTCEKACHLYEYRVTDTPCPTDLVWRMENGCGVWRVKATGERWNGVVCLRPGQQRPEAMLAAQQAYQARAEAVQLVYHSTPWEKIPQQHRPWLVQAAPPTTAELAAKKTEKSVLVTAKK